MPTAIRAADRLPLWPVPGHLLDPKRSGHPPPFGQSLGSSCKSLFPFPFPLSLSLWIVGEVVMVASPFVRASHWLPHKDQHYCSATRLPLRWIFLGTLAVDLHPFCFLESLVFSCDFGSSLGKIVISLII
ncbi:hypothetical protein NMG60_11033242 [Bertholletia excelsa]